MDRRRQRRAWGSARFDPGTLRPGRFNDIANEARRFLACRIRAGPESAKRRTLRAPTGSPEAARRLFAMSKPIAGTVVEAYLRHRGITPLHETASCAFTHAATIGPTSTARPRPGQRWSPRSPISTGRVTGVHRTWLDPAVRPLPRRRLRCRDGRWVTCSATRFASGRRRSDGGRRRHRDDAVAARFCPTCRWPPLSRPRISPACCSRIRCAGSTSFATRTRQATARWKPCSIAADAAGIEAIALTPRIDDFNEDLRTLGLGSDEGFAQDPSRATGRRALHGACSLIGVRVRRSAADIVFITRWATLPFTSEKAAATAFLRARALRQAARPGNGAAPGYFPPPLEPQSDKLPWTRTRGFASRSKITGLRHPSLMLRPSAALRVQDRSACRPSSPRKAAMGAADPTKESLNDCRS